MPVALHGSCGAAGWITPHIRLLSERIKDMPIDKRLFGRQLSYWRKIAGIEQSELANRTNISASYVSYLENGKKVPTMPVALALAGALGLKPADRDFLLQAVGYKPTVDPSLEEAFTPIYRLLEQSEITPAERDDFSLAVQAFVAQWRSQRERRKQRIQKAIVVAAGWQPRLLSSQTLERTLLHAGEEISKAGIPHMYAVVSEDTPDTTFEHLRKSLRNPKGKEKVPVTVTRIVQERPLGLGNAILTARQQLEGAPVAVLLPDEIDPSRETLGRMVALYDMDCRPILAVNPRLTGSENLEIRYYGIAFLDKSQSSSGRLHHINRVAEKPSSSVRFGSEVRAIAGRYILTSEVMDELQRLKPNERTGKYELTDAIASVLRSQTVLAFELDRPMLPLEPVRSLIEMLVKSINNRAKFEHVLRLTEKLVSDIEKI